LLQGLSVYYRETDYQPAKELAGRLARFLRHHAGFFDEDGSFLARHDGYLGKNTALHFHAHTNALLALLEYAVVAGETEYAPFARKGYEYARSTGTPQIGFFPEYIQSWPSDRHGVINSEGCAVADMVALAVKLSQAGVGDYWEDVDRYVRNLLTEMQLKRSRWVYNSVASQPLVPVNPETDDTFQAAERLVGNFAAWSSANEFCVWSAGITQCCLANAARSLYYVWDSMLQAHPGQLTIQLLLNRVSSTADITSDLPYAGRFRVHLKRTATLRVRKPAWLDVESVNITSSSLGGEVRFKLNQGYLYIAKRSAGEQLTFRFDLPERTIRTRVGHIDATMTLRGNEVVAFDPPGKNYPFWKDKDVRRDTLPEVLRTYFIPDRSIEW
jgi:hypothetical protein